MAARKGYEYEQNSQVGRWLKGADEKATAKLKDR